MKPGGIESGGITVALLPGAWCSRHRSRQKRGQILRGNRAHQTPPRSPARWSTDLLLNRLSKAHECSAVMGRFASNLVQRLHVRRRKHSGIHRPSRVNAKVQPILQRHRRPQSELCRWLQIFQPRHPSRDVRSERGKTVAGQNWIVVQGVTPSVAVGGSGSVACGPPPHNRPTRVSHTIHPSAAMSPSNQTTVSADHRIGVANKYSSRFEYSEITPTRVSTRKPRAWT